MKYNLLHGLDRPQCCYLLDHVADTIRTFFHLLRTFFAFPTMVSNCIVIDSNGPLLTSGQRTAGKAAMTVSQEIPRFHQVFHSTMKQFFF